ncbi:hypothetical protein [Verminephrobacter eiseniae]|uniref:hypothetical protein n=1 Tax=Verminephrobacter eiseniae TaxID=364317 RepID=UPI002239026B|nr:hypothetical protein [Verminephrobacter eiseniae]MCW5235286.1 hypothetical protein [Verminephrobacter eiseniae]
MLALLMFQEEHGTKVILFMESTDESSMLTAEERKQLITETARMKTGKMVFSMVVLRAIPT